MRSSSALRSSHSNISTYTEEYRPPGHEKPAKPRPSSATRRNNPHPKPDFLLPRSLQIGHGFSQDRTRLLARNYRQNVPVTDTGLLSLRCNTNFLPPVKYTAIPHKEGRPVSTMLKTLSEARGPCQTEGQFSHKTARARMLPSTGQLYKLDPRVREKQLQAMLNNIERAIESSKPSTQDPLTGSHCCPADSRPKTARAYRTVPCVEPLEVAGKGLCTVNTQSSSCPRDCPNRFRSKTALGFRCDYSCFQVVKKTQPGHYVIHPEFVSEGLV